MRTFGLRAVTGRRLLLGVAAGVAAFLAKGVVVLIATATAGASGNPQDIYAAGGSGSTASLILAALFLGELLRRSGSVWPGVATHMVYNFPTMPLMVWSQAAG